LWWGGNYQMYDDVLSGSSCSGWNRETSITSAFSLQHQIRVPLDGKQNIDKYPSLTEMKSLNYSPGLDIRPNYSSPAKAKATSTITFSDSSEDFYRQPRGEKWDIGAIQTKDEAYE
ncbi:MAG: hypothetical protein KC713_08630, partial [Candidatus Omnitrophica bacterium]|nr:hypothetical protein [Candidatus Omnitrophota bacterium]